MPDPSACYPLASPGCRRQNGSADRGPRGGGKNRPVAACPFAAAGLAAASIPNTAIYMDADPLSAPECWRPWCNSATYEAGRHGGASFALTVRRPFSQIAVVEPFCGLKRIARIEVLNVKGDL